MFSVRFRTLAELVAFLPEDEALLLDEARCLVLASTSLSTADTLPELHERISYNVPYFRGFRDVCFLWPGSVLWGRKRSYEGVRFGFAQGYLLQDAGGYLDRGTRKQIFWKDLTTWNPRDEQALRTLLFEAGEVDESLRAGMGAGEKRHSRFT